MSILALDVGFSATGWTVFEKTQPIACGVIKTAKSKKKGVRTADENALRGAQIARRVKEIVSEYQCKGIVGELPSGGAQSAVAMRDMAAATCAVSAAASVLDLPVEWCTPGDVKEAATGLKSGTKDEIMNAVASHYGWEVDTKKTEIKKGKRAGKFSVTKTFHVLGQKMCGGTFEHVADSMAAYWALRDGVLVKAFG